MYTASWMNTNADSVPGSTANRSAASRPAIAEGGALRHRQDVAEHATAQTGQARPSRAGVRAARSRSRIPVWQTFANRLPRLGTTGAWLTAGRRRPGPGPRGHPAGRRRARPAWRCPRCPGRCPIRTGSARGPGSTCTRSPQRLDYRPNLIARALPSGRTRMLALLVSDITNPHNFGLIRGAEAQASAAGYTLIIADTQGAAELEADHLDRLDSAVDGFVLASSRLAEPDLQPLRGRRPVVLFNREADGLPERRHRLGRRQPADRRAPGRAGPPALAYLAGPARPGPTASAGGAVGGTPRRPASRSPGSARSPPPWSDGAAAADAGARQRGDRAGRVQRPAGHRGAATAGALRVPVPDQLSVVGFDDIFGADFCHPPLTTVTSPVEAGRPGADRPAARPRDEQPRDWCCPPG